MALQANTLPALPITHAITSDLHYGNESKRDDWTVDDDVRISDEFYLLSPQVHIDDGVFVFAGDTGDLWRYGDEVFIAHTLIRKTVREYSVNIIGGNHDEGLWDQATPVRVITVGKNKVWIEHGHAHDPHPKRWQTWGRRLCRLLAWVGGAISPRTEDKLCNFGESLLKRGRHGDAVQMRVGVAQSARAQTCNLAVCGHSHEAWEGVIDGVRVVDVGTWRADGWVLICSDGSVHRWKLPRRRR